MPQPSLPSNRIQQKSFAEKVCLFILSHPQKFIYLSILLILLSLPGFWRIETAFGPKIWFSGDDINIKNLDLFEGQFGSDESVIIGMKSSQDLFSQEEIKVLFEITDRLWQVKDIVRVDSLANYHWSQALGDEIVTEPFLSLDNLSDEVLVQKKLAALKHRTIPNYLLDSTGQTAILYAHLIHRPDQESDSKVINQQINDLLSQYQTAGRTFYVTGQPTLNYRYQINSNHDIATLTPFMFALIFFYLIFSFRQLSGVLIPLTIILSTLVVVIGLTGYLNIKVNSLTMILPSIIIAVGIADSVHLMNSFYILFRRYGDKQRACQEAMIKNFWPVFLTSFSTAIGFFSLVPSDIVPIKTMGLLAGIGTMIAYYFSMALVMPLVLVLSIKRPSKLVTEIALPKHRINKYLLFLDNHNGKVILCFVFCSIIALWLGLKNEINANPYAFFKKNDPISIANDFFQTTLGGATGPELMIDSEQSDGIKDPVFLQKVDQFQNWMKSLPYVNTSISIIDILKEVNQSLNRGDADFYVLADQQSAIAEQLFLYTMGLPEGMDLNNRVDLENRLLRVSLLWTLQDSKTSLQAIGDIEKKSQELGLKTLVTGKSALFQRMNDYVIQTFFSSIGFALLLISVMMIYMCKNLKIGFISLIPNVIPLMFGAGLLYLKGQTIDVGCAIVASVTLGIAVDDTIHLLLNYSTARKSGLDSFEALLEVLSNTGLALILTTVILVTGFGVFIFASLIPNINFGLLSAQVLSMALVCDLVLLPALLLRFDRQNHSSKLNHQVQPSITKNDNNSLAIN
jgi:predicted RND superfamily exporter protein